MYLHAELTHDDPYNAIGHRPIMAYIYILYIIYRFSDSPSSIHASIHLSMSPLLPAVTFKFLHGAARDRQLLGQNRLVKHRAIGPPGLVS